MVSHHILGSVFVLLITRLSSAKKMGESSPSISYSTHLFGEKEYQEATSFVPSLSKEKRTATSFTVTSSSKINYSLPHKGENFINTGNGTVNSMMSTEDTASTTRDTIVVLITLTIIFITLIATYFLWRKHRSNSSASHSVYMYSRLSQNDVEVDNISFQGDLTHKSLINAVPVCAEEDSCDDDQVRPATLCLEYDALVTISNDETKENDHQRRSRRRSSTAVDDAPVNLLLDELSDEDLLQ